jgi:signal transduction histidine kinase
VVAVVLVLGILASFALGLVARAQVTARTAAEAAELEAEAQRRNLHALFMQAPAAVAILRGPELTYELSNPLNLELTGGRAVPGRRLLDAVPELTAQGVGDLVRRVYESGEPQVGREVPLTIRLADGGRRQAYVNGTYQPLRGAGGEVQGIMAFAYEVTDLVVARQRVERLADHLRDLTEDLRSAVRARDDFLSIAGHELRTPLTALSLQIEGLLRLARKGALGGEGTPLIARLEKLVAHTARIDRLVSVLLDVSRITGGRLRLQLEPVDLARLAREVIERLAEAAAVARSPIELRVTGAVAGRWDRVRLEQVLTNLVSNAVKYGAGQPVEIDVEARPGAARLRVRDHGVGVSPADRERIFGRFERAVSERHYGGLGLGLWISKQIVEALGGRIFLEEVDGPGSAFVVELPHDPPAHESQPHASAGGENQR